MSKMTQQRQLKRDKRRLKRSMFFLKHGIIKQLFGDTQAAPKHPMMYIPDQDPSESNHRRVVKQRLQSGRINVDGYKKAKGLDAEGPTS